MEQLTIKVEMEGEYHVFASPEAAIKFLSKLVSATITPEPKEEVKGILPNLTGIKFTPAQQKARNKWWDSSRDRRDRLLAAIHENCGNTGLNLDQLRKLLKIDLYTQEDDRLQSDLSALRKIPKFIYSIGPKPAFYWPTSKKPVEENVVPFRNPILNRLSHTANKFLNARRNESLQKDYLDIIKALFNNPNIGRKEIALLIGAQALPGRDKYHMVSIKLRQLEASDIVIHDTIAHTFKLKTVEPPEVKEG